MTSTQPISLLIMLVGVALLFFGIYLFFRQRVRLTRWSRAQGSIVELLPLKQSGEYIVVKTESGRKLQPKYLFRPVVRFETQAGKSVEFRAHVLTRPAAYRVGEQVVVLYDPADPRQALIDRPLYLWFYVLMLTFFGIFLFGMGLLGYLIQ